MDVTLTISKTSFLTAVGWVSNSLPTRTPVHPALAGIRMTVKPNSNIVTLFASDLINSSTETVELGNTIEEGADFVVHGKLLAGVVKALPGSTVTLALTDNAFVTVKSGATAYKIPVMQMDAYPPVPKAPESVATVDGEAFGIAIGRVVGATDTAPGSLLGGVEITLNPETKIITFAATDKYRLAVARVGYTPAAGSVEVQKVVIPTVVAENYRKAFTGETISVAAGVTGDTLFSVSGGERGNITRVMESAMPEWAALIPEEDGPTVTFVNAAEMLSALKRVTVAAERASGVNVTFDQNNQIVVTVANGMQGADASDTITSEHTGNTLSTKYNSVFVNAGLEACAGRDVKISLTAANKPAVITLKNDLAARGELEYVYLLMPMRGA